MRGGGETNALIHESHRQSLAGRDLKPRKARSGRIWT